MSKSKLAQRRHEIRAALRRRAKRRADPAWQQWRAGADERKRRREEWQRQKPQREAQREAQREDRWRRDEERWRQTVAEQQQRKAAHCCIICGRELRDLDHRAQTCSQLCRDLARRAARRRHEQRKDRRRYERRAERRAQLRADADACRQEAEKRSKLAAEQRALQEQRWMEELERIAPQFPSAAELVDRETRRTPEYKSWMWRRDRLSRAAKPGFREKESARKARRMAPIHALRELGWLDGYTIVTEPSPMPPSPMPPSPVAPATRQRKRYGYATTQVVVDEIERLHRQRWTGKQIATEIGVSPETVSRVLRRLGFKRPTGRHRERHRERNRERRRAISNILAAIEELGWLDVPQNNRPG